MKRSARKQETQFGRLVRYSIVSAVVAATALVLSTGALAAGSSIVLRGPHVNKFGTAFKYTASGSASGPANFVWGWEAPYGTMCASKYSAESKRPGIFLFVNKSVAKNARFSITINFLARNLERHRFCAYVVNKASRKTFAHAETTWTNTSSGTAPTGPSQGGLEPTGVGSGQCQAKHFPDLSVFAQVAVAGTSCTVAESVAIGADAARGAAYNRAGFPCKGTAEGPGSTWAAAWTGTYYVYVCASGSQRVAFNWGANYAYVPADTLPGISGSS
jgi:hypothetical protein